MNDIFNDILQTAEFREELVVAQCQARLAEILEEKGVSRAELARKLGVSRARVTQIFSDDAKNLTLRLLARSFLALDEEPVILTKSEYERLRRRVGSESGVSRDSGQTTQPSETLTASLIAELLRATEAQGEQDKPTRRVDSLEQWAKAGSNVVPIRRAANG